MKQSELSGSLISQYRSQLMGISMLLIILCHLSFQTELPILSFLQKNGSAGVDMFLFLSGFGMCFHHKKYPNEKFGEFMIARLKRIYPSYFVVVSLYSIWGILVNNWPISTFFWNWSMTFEFGYIFFEIPGGYNWYIPFLLIMYCTTPILFKIMQRHNSRFIIMMIILVGILGIVFDFVIGKRFWHMFARVPSYLLGLYFGMETEKKEQNWGLVAILFIASTTVIELIHHYKCDFGGIEYKIWYTSVYPVWAVTMVLLAAKLLTYIQLPVAHAILKSIGINSLEIYMINIWLTRLDLLQYVSEQALKIGVAFLIVAFNIVAGYLLNRILNVRKIHK